MGSSWNIPGPDKEVDDLQSATLEKSPDMVSLVELKQLVVKLLPPTSILRTMVLSEKDLISRSDAIAKLEIFVRLLYMERSQ